MIANLLIMMIIGGYETFVSRPHLDDDEDQPEWLSHVNAGMLKVKLATALIRACFQNAAAVRKIHLPVTCITGHPEPREGSIRTSMCPWILRTAQNDDPRILRTRPSISSTHLLKTFIEIRSPELALNPEGVKWQVIVHVIFVLSAAFLAWTDKLMMTGAAAHGSGKAAH